MSSYLVARRVLVSLNVFFFVLCAVLGVQAIAGGRSGIGWFALAGLFLLTAIWLIASQRLGNDHLVNQSIDVEVDQELARDRVRAALRTLHPENEPQDDSLGLTWTNAPARGSKPGEFLRSIGEPNSQLRVQISPGRGATHLDISSRLTRPMINDRGRNRVNVDTVLKALADIAINRGG